MSDIANKHFLVVGLGQTGASVVRFLSAAGARITVVDSRETPPQQVDIQAQFPQVTIVTGSFDPALLDGVDELVVSPGVDLRDPLIAQAHERGLPINGDIEWFARNAKAPVVAITGSNGKSTVTALVAAMAEAAGRKVAMGGNFGIPALDLLDTNPEIYVLELSSFQLELTRSLRATAACVLNVSPDHIDRHGSLEHYAALKASIYQNAESAVVNADDALVADMPVGDAQVLQFGRDVGGCGYSFSKEAGDTWLQQDQTRLIACSELQLRGEHNYLNALAALALGAAAGLPQAAMLQALKTFAGLAHRCQWVANYNGVDWVNDSKGTNVGAMLASLEGFDGPIVLLAGGQAKGADFTPVAPVLSRKGRLALLFGADAGLLETAIKASVKTQRVAGLQDAVRAAAQAAQPGDTVLLSPGCASFDMFTGYQDRGEQFSAAVLELAA